MADHSEIIEQLETLLEDLDRLSEGLALQVRSYGARTVAKHLRLHGDQRLSSKVLLATTSKRYEEELRAPTAGRLRLDTKLKPRGPRVRRPPGYRILYFADLFFSNKTRRDVLEPTVRDLQDEYAAALSEQRPWKARIALLRGYVAFWAAVVARVPLSLAKTVVRLWRASAG